MVGVMVMCDINSTLFISQGIHEEANAAGIKTQHCLNDMIDKWTLEYDSKTWKKIKQ